MELDELDYDLPPELIAQQPAARRDAARLLVYDRRRDAVRHRVFSELPEEVDGEPRGETPLPPYIVEPLDDPARYQTVYARDAGSAAAPTAGLHFTPELLAQLDVERVTLHVGLDTFRPVSEESLEEHAIHGERYSAPAWPRIEAAERVLAVGTTTTRVLETLAR